MNISAQNDTHKTWRCFVTSVGCCVSDTNSLTFVVLTLFHKAVQQGLDIVEIPHSVLMCLFIGGISCGFTTA